MATFATELTKNVTDGVKAQLIADGVIEAPKTPSEMVAEKLQAFEAEVKNSFGQVTDAMSLIVEQMAPDAPAPPASVQSVNQPAPVAPTVTGREPRSTDLDIVKSLTGPTAPAAPAPVAAPALTDPVVPPAPQDGGGMVSSVFMQALASGQQAPN